MRLTLSAISAASSSSRFKHHKPSTKSEEISMAKGMNKVFLLGNVGKDPEIRSTNGGMSIASLTLATADRQKDAQGNWVDKTEWHNLIAFQKTADIVKNYVKKGSQILIEGKIQTRSWDDKESGQRKYRTEILINDLTLLGDPKGSHQAAAVPVAAATADELTDDDIPF
jgi:single-strand DNA-binding protein